MIEKLIEIQLSLVKEIKALSYKRYLFEKINWKNRLIGIVGARGVGKTTLLLQHYLHNFKNPQDLGIRFLYGSLVSFISQPHLYKSTKSPPQKNANAISP